MSRFPRLILADNEVATIVEMRRAGIAVLTISERVGYNPEIVRRVMDAHGLPRRFDTPWSPDEDTKLQAVCWPIARADLVAMFPGRSYPAIDKRCRRIGIDPRCAGIAPYTKAETGIVIHNFGRTPIRTWAHMLPGRTIASIGNHARFLGLKSGLQRAMRFNDKRNPKRIRPAAHQASSPT